VSGADDAINERSEEAMSLDKVVEDILRKGEMKKGEIIRVGEKERDEQVTLAAKRITETMEKAERGHKSAIAQMEQQEVSSAELESKRIVLETQKKVMDELKGQVLADLSRMTPDKRRRVYSKLIARARSELGDCFVYSSDKDKALLQLPSGIQNGGTIDTRGGLVFESKDRTVRLDYRFETILEDIWASEMKEIYSRLFG